MLMARSLVQSCCSRGRTRENRENGGEKCLSGKTQGIRKSCQNTGTVVRLSPKIPDSIDQRYHAICREIFADRQKNWENTDTLKVNFECQWGPCVQVVD